MEDQALGPIQNPIEMAISLEDLVKKLNGISGYKELFQKAFGTLDINPERIGKAIATFERTVVSGNSAFDRHERRHEGIDRIPEKRVDAIQGQGEMFRMPHRV